MPTLEERIRLLEDFETIRQLKAHYAQYPDAKYTDDHQRRPQAEIDTLAREQASVFTDDAIWDNGVGPSGILRGREAIYNNLRLGPWKFAMHHFLSPRIEVDGDKATGRWMLWQTATLAESDTAVFMSAITNDEYVRTPTGWKMSRMAFTLKYMTRFDRPWSVQKNEPFKP
jgi:SnoaL-like domain